MAKLNKAIECPAHGKQLAVFICIHVHSAADVAFTDGEDFHCSIDGAKHTSEEIQVLCRVCASLEGLILQ